MPIDYVIDEERKVLVARAHGELCDADLLDYGQRLCDDESIKRANHELVDLTGVLSSSLVSAEGVRELARFWHGEYARLSASKLAIIAPTDLAFGLGRMYQMLRDDGPDHIRIFREGEEAWEWLAAPDA
jgi:hypothetical protein